MHALLHKITCPVLQEVASSFWQVDRRCAIQQEIIVPKGTLEIIFNLGEEPGVKATVGGKSLSLPRCFISGYHTSSIRMLIPGRQYFFGIYLHTTAVNRILRINAADFANKCLDLTLVDDSINLLWHQLGASSSFPDKVSIISHWLMQRAPQLTARERLLDAFLHDSHISNASVSQLAGTLCYSSRQLSRKLLALTGMNAEQVLLYKKYLHSLELIHSSPESLVSIGYQAGFSDQSHFIKTFKTFAGMRPGEYRVSRSAITGHIFEDVR
jgi:AraC-like DNA-binding protein